MPARRSARGLDYDASLRAYLEDEPSEPPKRRGRPKDLDGQTLGQFLKAIAEIVSKNPKYVTNQSIAGKLMERPEYARLGLRQLRRKVAEAIDEHIRSLHLAPTTRKAMREKAFEHLRHALRRHHELMAKKQQLMAN
jgi:hypothetical protein